MPIDRARKICYNIDTKEREVHIMMKRTLVERKPTREVYKVTGVIINRTDAELLDFCDLNNFGGIVRRYGKYVAYVTVYTD